MHALKTARPIKNNKRGVELPRLMARKLAQAFKASLGESETEIRAIDPRFRLNTEIIWVRPWG
jgi:hypothetical protein